MKDYCTCGFRRIEHTFLSEGFLFCSHCEKQVCCGTVSLDKDAKPHGAEIAHKDHFVCWLHHRDGVADLKAIHSEPGHAT